MNRNIMAELADARPAHLDPARPVARELRASELAAAVRGLGGNRVAVPGRRGLGRSGLRLGVAVAAAASVAVAVAVVAPGHQPPGRPSAGQVASARQILLTAATASGRAKATAGVYWFTDQTHGADYLIHGLRCGCEYLVQERNGARDWTNGHTPDQSTARIKAGRGLTATHYWAWRDLGVRPVGAGSAAAMRRDGSPQHWPDFLPVGFDSTNPGPWVTYQEQTAFTSAFNFGSLARLRTLPTTPGGLRSFFMRHQAGNTTGRGTGSDEQWVASAATYMLATEPVPPAVRAAAFRLLAGLPGVRDAGPATDPLGRHGIAIAMPFNALEPYADRSNGPMSGTSARLIVDAPAGRLLAVESVLVRPGPGSGDLPRGSVVAWTAFGQAVWTGHAPRHAIIPPG